jgi:hypothetical protein
MAEPKNHDPEEKLYSGIELEDEDGNTYVPRQQSQGEQAIEGGGEFPDPSTPPQAPAPGSAEPEDD